MKNLTIQLYFDGRWNNVAMLDSSNTKPSSPIFSYAKSHVLAYFGQNDQIAVSSTDEVDFFPKQNTNGLPTFVYDIAPQGYGKRRLLQDWPNLGGYPDDWYALSIGAANPIGNIRIKEAAEHFQREFGAIKTVFKKGFSKEEVLNHTPEFIDYVVSCHYGVAGSSGLQGECPKYLLVEDVHRKFHIDGMIDDAQVVKHYILKMPKTHNNTRDLQILTAEPSYLEIARDAKCKVGGKLEVHNGSLLIPRFDRKVTPEGVQRIAQESLLTMMNKPGYGITFYHQEAISAMAKYCTTPYLDIAEYVFRDMLNIALGNRDNHGRNTAFHRYNGVITIAPLFDFAPMYLDQDAIARSATWQQFEKYGRVDYLAIMDWMLEEVEPVKSNAVEFVKYFRERLPILQNMNWLLAKHQVDEKIASNRQESIGEIAHQAEKLESLLGRFGNSARI